MKAMFENIKNSFYLQLASGIFVVQTFFSFYESIKYESMTYFLNGLVDNLFWFLVLYALGVLMNKKK